MRGLREPFNALSHLIGAVLAMIGASYLIVQSLPHPIAVTAFLIYGFAITLLFASSGIYHALYGGGKWLQRLDHSAIFIMIAGSYTPVALIGVPGKLGTTMMVLEWSMALIGVVATVIFGGGPSWLRLTLYLAMGWLAVFALGPLSSALTPTGLTWLLAGGMLYTVGCVIYASKRPKLWPGKFGSHELWHLFVLAGGGAHYMVMLALLRV